MRHLKRFRNSLVYVYYALCAFRLRFGASDSWVGSSRASFLPQAEAAPAEVVMPIEHAAATAQEKTVNEVSVTAKEYVAPIAEPKKVVPPPQKVTTVPQQPVATQSSAVPPPKTQDPQASSPKVKPQGTNGAATPPRSAGGKYDPGTVNDQTAQRLARLLVSEIKLYYKSETDGAGASEVKNIYDMLKDPIDKSRQHYKRRIGESAIKTMPDYFHGELVRSLCGGDPSRLGPNYQASV